MTSCQIFLSSSRFYSQPMPNPSFKRDALDRNGLHQPTNLLKQQVGCEKRPLIQTLAFS